VGSWAIPALVRLVNEKHITLIDGDVLERRNLDRQLFNVSDIGRKKAEALGEMYGVSHMESWYAAGLFAHDKRDWLLVFADNHVARSAALAACDMSGCKAIIAANETHSSEAYYYDPEWKGTEQDPRVYYPEIETDRSGDPQARGAGCTGEAQSANVQLVTANMMAASLAMHLYVLWTITYRKLDADVRPFIPHRIFQNMTKSGSCNSVKQKGQTE
jgi:hypothetical protein